MSIDINTLGPGAQKQILNKLAVQNPTNAHIARKVTGRSKYGAVKTWEYGLCTDSKKEASYLADCVLLCKAKALAGFLYHGKILLAEGSDKAHRAITYEPDFVLLKTDGTYELIDTKGMETREFKNKMKIMRERYPLMKEVTIQK